MVERRMMVTRWVVRSGGKKNFKPGVEPWHAESHALATQAFSHHATQARVEYRPSGRHSQVE